MHICGSPQLYSFRPLNSLNITFKTLTEKHGECIHTEYEALCTLLHALFNSVRLFLFLLVNGGCTMISISHFPLNSFELVRLICFLFGCLHFLSSLSLSSCRFGVPSLRPSVCFQFTVYSNAAGCSEPLGMKSRLVSDSQLSASSSYRTWGIDTFTWHPQFARLDKQGKTNAWSPAHNNRSEWIQVSETSKCH